MQLALGTAQWGTSYGLTNRRGELDDGDVRGIVDMARELGVTAVDTHRTTRPEQGYGRAQGRLRPWAGEFAVTTKVYGGAAADMPVADQLARSLEDLGVTAVHGCLVHDWYELSHTEAAETARALDDARERGVVEVVGISAYDEIDIARAREAFAVLGVVQVPSSALDQRLRESTVLSALSSEGAELQVRSVFLQGLLLDATAGVDLASHPDVVGFHATCRELGMAPIEACLAYVRALPWCQRVVVGVTSADELAEIGSWWRKPAPEHDWSRFASSDTRLLDPRRWKR